MANQTSKRLLALVLAICLSLGLLLPAGQANATGSAGILTEITGEEREQLSSLVDGTLAMEEQQEELPAADTPVRVFIVLSGKSALEQGYAASAMAEATAYTGRLLNRQAAVIQSIETQVLEEPLEVRYQFTAVANAISAVVPYGSMEEIAALPGVEQVCPVPVYETCQTEVSPMTITTGDMVGSYGTWENGYTGAGMRIAVIDTGLDLDHPSFDPAAYDYALGQAQGSWDLLDQKEIAQVLPRLTIAKDGLTAADLYRNTKVAFGYNYVDGDLDITHDNDPQGDHGTHVAGIATANRYIRQGSSFASAAETVLTCGIAPEAQLLVMKVFGKNGGAYSDDYMAAIQDAMYLGCDVINLSLGSNNPGFVDPAGSGVAFAEQLFQSLTQTDVVVTIAAGNAYSAGFKSATGTDLHRTTDPDVNTAGSPGSYENALTVASVTNSGMIGPYISVGQVNASFTPAGSSPEGIQSWNSLDESGQGTEYPFVFLGDPTSATDTKKYATSQSDFSGLDVAGKIVFISRGTSAFSDKHSFAAKAGAKAVIIYNNTSGTVNMDLSASTGTIPCVFMTQKDMQRILAVTEKDQKGCYGGVMTLHSIPTILENAEDGYRMSEFSSWGIPGDLSLKPEITAPGGNIYSTLDGGTYGIMSGTSMASPAMAGLSALVLQYIEGQNLAERTGLSARALAQALLMSTAKPLTEESGLPYSPRKQGAGLANAQKAVTAQSYLLSQGTGNDGKVKAELGDDPDRTGAYQFSFSIYNLSQEAKTYAFGSDVLTESVVTIDGVDYMAESSHRLAPKVRFAVSSMPYDLTGDNQVNREDALALLRYCNGTLTLPQAKLALLDLNQDGKVTTADAQQYLCQLEALEGAVMENTGCTVAPGGSATVTVNIDLSSGDRAYLDRNFENGMYVDGFVYVQEVEQTTQEGVILEKADLSIPFLAYYGSWSEPPMLEDAWYYDGNSLENSYSGGFNAAVVRVDGQSFGLGLNPYTTEASPYAADRNAISPNGDGAADCLSAVRVSLLRNAAELSLRVESEDGTQVYYQETQKNLTRAFYYPGNGTWRDVTRTFSLGWAGTDGQGQELPDGTTAMICVTAVTEYGDQGQTWKFPVTVDRSGPAVALKTLDSQNRTLAVTVAESQYLASAVLLDSNKSQILQRLPVDDQQKGKTHSLTFDLSQVYTTVCYLAVSDYAMNTTYYKVDLSELNPEYEENTFYGFNFFTDRDSGWISFTEETLQPVNYLTGVPERYSAAEYVDGTLYATTQYELHIMKDGEFQPTKVRTLEVNNSAPRIWGNTVLDMAYDYSTETMYALGFTLLNQYTGKVFLYTLDLDTGVMDQVGTAAISGTRTKYGVGSLACDLEGNLYCVERGNVFAEFYQLKLEDGEPVCTRIGSTGFGSDADYITSMAFDHNTGALYWANCYGYILSGSSEGYQHSLIRLDPATGEGTDLGRIEGFETVGLYIPYDRTHGAGQVNQLALPETARLFEGQSTQLNVVVKPANALDKGLIWTSSDESVATVDETGTVTGHQAGTATITVTAAAAPDVTATCEMTVHAFDGKAMTGFLEDTGSGQPGWIRFNAAAPENYTVVQETPGVHVVSACMEDDVIYASGYDAEHPNGALYVLDAETFEMKQCFNTQMLFAGIQYSAMHNCVLFAYQSYFGFVPLEDMTIEGDSFSAGTPLYFDLSSHLKDDFFAAATDTGYPSDYFKDVVATCMSGKSYLLLLTDDFRLSMLQNVDLRVEAYADLRNSMYYSHSRVSGEVLYYSVYNKSAGESVLYAVTPNTNGEFEPLRLGTIGNGQAPLTGIFVDYPTEAGIRSAELPELTEETCLLTMEASELQVYQPPVSQDTQP